MPHYDVYGIGHALVDTQYRVTEGVLADAGIEKGVMTLVDEERRQEVLAALSRDPVLSSSGGSAANTMIALARFGGRACYAYQVGDDAWGRFYREDLDRAGVESQDSVFAAGSTGQCLVMVTPDADRSMNTFLGASGRMGPHQIDDIVVGASRYVYVEGYLLTTEEGFAACERATAAAHSQGVAVAVTLSDPFVVDAFKARFDRLVDAGVDLLFCNEEEAMTFSGCAQRAAAARALAERVGRAFITCGAEGALVCAGEVHELVPGHAVDAIDTTGAGDSFAGGVLYGLCRDLAPPLAARLGNYAAACVVSAFGSRLQPSLADRVDAILAGDAPLLPPTQEACR